MTARPASDARKKKMPRPATRSAIVSTRPAGESGIASLNPTVVIVMTVMYNASNQAAPSTTM